MSPPNNQSRAPYGAFVFYGAATALGLGYVVLHGPAGVLAVYGCGLTTWHCGCLSGGLRVWRIRVRFLTSRSPGVAQGFLRYVFSSEHGPFYMACPEGIEPPTHSLEGCCSIQLSYGQTVTIPAGPVTQGRLT